MVFFDHPCGFYLQLKGTIMSESLKGDIIKVVGHKNGWTC
jgi:hypothetical protein